MTLPDTLKPGDWFKSPFNGAYLYQVTSFDGGLIKFQAFYLKGRCYGGTHSTKLRNTEGYTLLDEETKAGLL